MDRAQPRDEAHPERVGAEDEIGGHAHRVEVSPLRVVGDVAQGESGDDGIEVAAHHRPLTPARALAAAAVAVGVGRLQHRGGGPIGLLGEPPKGGVRDLLVDGLGAEIAEDEIRHDPPIALVVASMEMVPREVAERAVRPDASPRLLEAGAVSRLPREPVELAERVEAPDVAGVVSLRPPPRRERALAERVAARLVEGADQARGLGEEPRGPCGDGRVAGVGPVRELVVVRQVDAPGMTEGLHAGAHAAVLFL